ncbi:MAG: hypothetical protein NTW94_01775 [Legionellales bacterium]|nr:hypothetical protein [Legionellales bacterium]
MLKTCVVSVILGVLMSTPVYAQKNIKLAPNETKTLKNPFLWTLNATCNLQGKARKGKILVRVLENKGEVNGKKLSKGQSTSVNVNNHDNFSVSAEAGSTVYLVNLGADTLEAVCYT